MRRFLLSLLAGAGIIAPALTLNAADTVLTYSDIKPVLSANCSGCHTWDTAYTNLVGPVSGYAPTTGKPIVYPAQPDSSVIIWRLLGVLPSGKSLTRMPSFADKLSDADILSIRTWIQQGALEKSALPPEPPSNVQVSDVPADQGNFITITWTPSPSESGGGVSRYRIFHSRSSVLTDPLPMPQFPTREALIAADAHSTILVDSVAVGKNEYTDFVPVNGETYYVWLQAVGPGGASKMAASGAPTFVAETPREFTVNAPYPNPFNPTTTIEYFLPRDARVLLKIFTVTGQQAAVLADGLVKAGKHSVVWNAAGMPSGVYLYTLSYGGVTRAGKMALLK